VKLSVPFRIGLLGTIAVEAALVFYAWRTGAPSENYFHWNLSNHCAWVKVPYAKLEGPEVYGLSSSEEIKKNRWVGTLLTDQEHRKAFYLLD